MTAVKAVLLAVQHTQDPVGQPVVLEIGLALLGAALGGLLLTPFIRTMRSFVSALDVPEWAMHQLRFPAWLPFTLHLNLVLPAVGMVVWVRPLPVNSATPPALICYRHGWALPLDAADCTPAGIAIVQQVQMPVSYAALQS